MKAILRATAVLAGSSVVTVAMGVLSAKAFALLVGPAGVGYLGVLQSTIGLGSLVAGMGLATGFVRFGAAALGGDDEKEVAALWTATTGLTWLLGTAVALSVILLRHQLTTWLEPAIRGAWAVPTAAGITLTTTAAIQSSRLNAHHRVDALAKLAIVNSVLGAALSVLVLAVWRRDGIPWVAVTPLGVSWLLSRWMVRRVLGRPALSPDRGRVLRASRALLRFGGPYTGSMVVGTGVQMALPMLVLGTLDLASVGYFRAATALSVGYLGFLLTAMGQEYYPRVSAARSNVELCEIANTQIRLVSMVGVPVILLAQLTTPYLVPLFYSRSFAPAVGVLRWQWVGDLFKLWSWTLSFIVLAHGGSRLFFLIELVAGATLLLGSLTGMHLIGLAGLGAGYLLTTVVYSLLVWSIVRRRIGFAMTTDNARTMGSGLAGSLVLFALSWSPSTLLRLGGGAVVVAVTGGTRLVRLWREVRPRRAASASGVPAGISRLLAGGVTRHDG